MPKNNASEDFDPPERADVEWDVLTEEADPTDAEEMAQADDLFGVADDEDEGADEVLEEDDDNPYQESDQALPDDSEEAAIGRDFDRDGEIDE